MVGSSSDKITDAVADFIPVEIGNPSTIFPVEGFNAKISPASVAAITEA